MIIQFNIYILFYIYLKKFENDIFNINQISNNKINNKNKNINQYKNKSAHKSFLKKFILK